ncbi:hypothetical protein QE152_g22241 [Popillia japonica]|uniref:Uncharacterized protein n=1 Tax=Popillia japonica TaxID=7064 RepID=A0AAW1KM75_POPJA
MWLASCQEWKFTVLQMEAEEVLAELGVRHETVNSTPILVKDQRRRGNPRRRKSTNHTGRCGGPHRASRAKKETDVSAQKARDKVKKWTKQNYVTSFIRS